MDDALKGFVRERADSRCEYWRLPQAVSGRLPYHVDHVRAIQHRGETVSANLCYACSKCNYLKGPNLSSYDPLTDELVRLFNPRQDDWDEHFRSEGPVIAGITPEGRSTAMLLGMNEPKRVRLRQVLQENDEM